MKIGTCHMWGEDIQAFRDEVRLSGELGFSTIGIGDSPAGWHDLYMSMAVAAQESPNATIMPFVTSPKVRHPLATANALCSLHDLTVGRVACGLSTGGSNTMAIGHYPATQLQIRDYLQALQGLFTGDSVSYEGRPVSALRFPRKIPIYYSAFGPKALQLAGEQADGVILFTGENIDILDKKIETVRNAATKAGRNADNIDIIVTSFCSVRATRDQAIDDIKAFIIVNGMAIRTPELIAQVPKEYLAGIEELHRRYDPTEHCIPDGKNAQLLDELGLRDYLSQFDTIAGSSEHVAGIIKQLEQRGVSTFIANMPGHAAKSTTMRELAAMQ